MITLNSEQMTFVSGGGLVKKYVKFLKKKKKVIVTVAEIQATIGAGMIATGVAAPAGIVLLGAGVTTAATAKAVL